jgi:hypothetical protein
MSDLDDALAQLERALLRLEAAPLLGDSDANTRLAAERAAADQHLDELTAAILARVEAALDKIGQALETGLPEGDD